MASAGAHVLVVAATLFAVAACVLVQYESLTFVWRRLPGHRGHRRVKVLYSIVSVILLHAAEIAVFGATMRLLLLWPACGVLEGSTDSSFFDCLYVSAATFSTMGLGDISATGPIRFLIAIEALTGFVLITWSGAFSYLEMAKFWRAPERR